VNFEMLPVLHTYMPTGAGIFCGAGKYLVTGQRNEANNFRYSGRKVPFAIRLA
jgi:hypothetical protein